MKIPQHRMYVVHVPRPHTEWARIWITADGSISILSDYGNFGYWFGSPGCEFRRFLTGCGDDYLASKFADGERVLDGHATERNAKAMVLRNRRDKTLTREGARQEWDAVCGVDWSQEYDRCRWYFEETSLVEDYGCAEVLVYIVPPRVTRFLEVLWPLFVEQLKAELAAEAEHVHPGFDD